MKAVTYTKYGSPAVLKISNVETPTPQANEVLVKINNTSLTSGDRRIRAADPFVIRFNYGLTKPKHPILGHEFAGVIEAIGENVTEYQVGDRVFGSTDMRSGTHVEYITMPEDGVLTKSPDNISDAILATIPVGALTAVFFLNKMGDIKGKKIMIYGAAGSVGTFALQIAVLMRASVTVVCNSARNDAMKTLGAEKVIDYRTQDFKKLNEKYDHIFDAVGLSSFPKMKHLIKENGKFLTVAMNLSLMMQSLGARKTIEMGVTKQTKEDLIYLAKLVENEDLKPVIDREFDLDDIRAAHVYVDRGHKFGNVLININ